MGAARCLDNVNPSGFCFYGARGMHTSPRGLQRALPSGSREPPRSSVLPKITLEGLAVGTGFSSLWDLWL